MSSNDTLSRHVTDELFWDPKVDSAAIAVSANEGSVTLRGTVGSLHEKREAQRAARRVYGVVAVDSHLKVKLLGDKGRADAELRGDVLQALMLNSLVPTTVDALVEDGMVTLTGTVSWSYQRDEAEFVATNIAGVLDVIDEITIVPPTPDADDLQDSITRAFKRNASFDAEDLTVSTAGGTVTISGNVRSWAEHGEAIDAAWAAPGVRSVRDQITISY
jgi:osmotically-inducible protein OsmY